MVLRKESDGGTQKTRETKNEAEEMIKKKVNNKDEEGGGEVEEK
jgi:hypothetical protein